MLSLFINDNDYDGDDENYKMSIVLQTVKSSDFGQVNVDLGPGTVLLLDNWRVTHSRTAYTGHRWVSRQFRSCMWSGITKDC